MRRMLPHVGGFAACLTLTLLVGCNAAPTSPSAPAVALTFGPDEHFATAPGPYGLLVSAAIPILNLQCTSNNGDRVTTAYEQLDWDVYGWHAWLQATTVGRTTVSCTADPNAAGSTTVSVRLTRAVTVKYVREPVQALLHVDPIIGGRLEVNSNFRESDGAFQWPGSCTGSRLAWNSATQTLTCSPAVFRFVAVDYLNAACVEDPASARTGFRGGTVSINGTKLTVLWNRSTMQRQCWLFTMDANGSISPPG